MSNTHVLPTMSGRVSKYCASNTWQVIRLFHQPTHLGAAPNEFVQNKRWITCSGIVSPGLHWGHTIHSLQRVRSMVQQNSHHPGRTEAYRHMQRMSQFCSGFQKQSGYVILSRKHRGTCGPI